MDFAMANYAPGNQVGSNRIPNARRSVYVASNSNPWVCIAVPHAPPRYCRSSLTVDGGSSSAMAAPVQRWRLQFSDGGYFFRICSYSLASHSMSQVQKFLLLARDRSLLCHPGKRMREVTPGGQLLGPKLAFLLCCFHCWDNHVGRQM